MTPARYSLHNMFWTSFLTTALLLAPSVAGVAVPVDHEPLIIGKTDSSRKLHGRFLHMTDFHPDPFYIDGSSPGQKCHRGDGDAGHFGSPTTPCDSPWSLIDETLGWVRDNLRDKIDFVVWTGDSARHDNDDLIPRSPAQIYDLNRKTVSKVLDVFQTNENETSLDPLSSLFVPVVPTLGNNDIFPHNIMEPGPSQVTRQYADIWRSFLPETQYHVFEKGGYYWQQVLPGRNGEWGPSSDGGLAVFSLNTLYFFNSNAAVDGCDKSSEPGYGQMEWLKNQLQIMRDRNMKAILIGHVPPAWTSTKQSWDETCWKKYVLWSKQYRDVIAGHIYGHMNLDHFMILDSRKGLKPRDGKKRKHKKHGGKSSIFDYIFQIFTGKEKPDVCSVDEFDPELDPIVSVTSASDYLQSLREEFAELPSPSANKAPVVGGYDKLIGGKWGERYMVTLVGPSVVPNYFPTLRVFEYNITGLADETGFFKFTSSDNFTNETKGMKSKKPKKPKIDLPDGPSPTEPPGPAYSMQPLSLTGYTQYFLNLTKYNDPVENANNTKVEFEVEYDTRTDKIYKLKDLTVRSYLKLAHQIVDATAPTKPKKGHKNSEDDVADEDDYDRQRKKKKKHGQKKKRDRVWHKFVERAFVGTISPDQVKNFRASAAEGCEVSEL